MCCTAGITAHLPSDGRAFYICTTNVFVFLKTHFLLPFSGLHDLWGRFRLCVHALLFYLNLRVSFAEVHFGGGGGGGGGSAGPGTRNPPLGGGFWDDARDYPWFHALFFNRCEFHSSFV